MYKELEKILPQTKNIFLVTGKKSYKTSGAEETINKILKKNKVFRFSNFAGNPKIEDVKKGTSLFKKQTYDLIIAVGGGSVIDMAKLIKNESMSKIPLIAIPTTAGSGSEATHFAVLYVGKVKHSVADRKILPNMTILDPRLSMKLDQKLTATTGMDAFSQAIESYWAIGSTKTSQKYAKESIKLLLKNIEKAIKEPTLAIRRNMLRASNLAGKAINISKTTAPHALSYTLTSYFDVLHGQAVGVFLPAFLEFNYRKSKNKKTINELLELLKCKDIYEARNKIQSLMKNIGLKTTLSELGIEKKNDLEKIVNNVNTERLGNNPAKITKKELKDIIKQLS
ncbi:MAG: phosphonoacetaldehyde reductase [Patescibacteria group bacterium]